MRFAMPDMLPKLNEALRGRYHAEGVIGVGGMATVYLARDLRHPRQVALKVLDPQIATTVGSARFLAEIRTAATLQHPHILPLFDSGDAEGFLYYVMPYVQGPTLQDRLDAEGRLPPEEAVRIIGEVAEALDYAHRRGVIHRDIKPGNILLHEGHALVADFGIARILEGDSASRLTDAGRSIGTPGYMSPEQATGDTQVDHRSDIFSLGCVLYEALAGVPPFDGPTVMAIVSRVLTETPPPLSHRSPEASSLEPIVARALQPQARDRFSTAGELVEALRTSGSPSPDAVTGMQAVRGPGSRIPGPAAILFALLVLLGGSLWAALRLFPSGSRDAGVATVAVLPFRPVGEGVEAIATGITLTTRDRLAVLDGIEVIGGVTSSNQGFLDLPAPTIADRIGADYILRATVERIADGHRIQVQPELFSADGGRIGFWDETPLTVNAGSLSSLETSIAEDVARALDITVGAAARANLTPPAANPAAYEAYLRGRNLAGEARAARMREAIALDSTFALAHAELAHQAILRGQSSRSPADSAVAFHHASNAIRHGPQLAQGYQAMGLYHRSVTRNPDSALYYLNQAESLAPGDAEVMHFRASALWLAGQVDSALVEAERGAALDRLSASAVSRVSRILLWKGELEEAWLHHLDARPLAVEGGEDFVIADGPLILAAMGMADSARAYLSDLPAGPRRDGGAVWMIQNYLLGWLVEDSLAFRLCREGLLASWGNQPQDRQVSCAMLERRRGDPVRASRLADSARVTFRALVDARPRDERLRMRLAYATFLLGDAEGALTQADSSIASVNTFWDYYPGAANALAYVRLAGMAGDAGRAVPELRRMLEGFSPITADWLKIDPAFDPIRSDPAFQDLLEGHGS
jgi:serine/threonine-protein kinase